MASRLTQASIRRGAPGQTFNLSAARLSVGAGWLRQIVAGVLLLIPVGAAWGQPACPFDVDGAVADTLDPKGYYPLQVGNVWEYVSDNFGFLEGIQREEIVADTLIEGTTFYIRETTRFETRLEEDPPITEVRSIFRSYIAVTDSSILFWTEGYGVEQTDVRFNQEFNSCYEGDLVGGSLVIVGGEYDEQFYIEEDRKEVAYKAEAIKIFAGAGGSLYYGYGIGKVSVFGDPSITTNIVYAKIDGQELGIPIDERFNIIVSTEAAPILRDSRLNVYPNPVHSLTHFVLVLAQPGNVSIQIYDMLGRLVATPVEEAHFAAGTHTVAWSAESMAPGIYAARLTVAERPVARARLAVVH